MIKRLFPEDSNQFNFLKSFFSSFKKDFIGELLIDAPDGFACLIITVPVFLNDDKISRPVNISL